MANYQKVIVKLSNTQSKKLKSAVKNNTNTILRLNMEILKMKNYYINYF